VSMLVPAAALAALAALAAEAAVQIGPVSGSFHLTVDRGFAALLAPVAAQSDATGADVQSLLGDAELLDRPSLFATLQSLVTATADQLQAFDLLVPPAPAPGILDTCRAALAGRHGGVIELQRAVEEVIGGRSGSVPVGPDAGVTLPTAVATMMQADGAFAACRLQLRRAPVSARLAPGRWVTGAEPWSSPSIDRLASALASSPSLAAHHQLNLIALSTSPPVLAGPGGGVMAPTGRLQVDAVVANAGNVDEPAVSVQVSVVPLVGPGPQPLMAIVVVPAGRSVTVVVGPFAVRPGSMYRLQVTAAPPQGPGATSSSTTVQVAEVPTTTTTTTTTMTTTTTTTIPSRRRKGAPPPGR